MSININTAISALDSPTSLIQFWVKDAFDVTGRTVMANNEGGKHEAREKFVEESGTGFFWIFGIPAIRKIANKMAKGKVDTDIHFKRINTNGIQGYFADKLNKFSKEDLKGIVLNGEKIAEVQAKLKNAGFKLNGSKGKYAKFHIGVTTAAVLINLFMLSVALPLFNQFVSRKIIAKEVKENEKKAKKQAHFFGNNHKNSMDEFLSKVSSKKDKPSFGSLKDLFNLKQLFNFKEIAEKAQLNPVNSMLILDYGIAGSRVSFVPRDNNERLEYAVKEGGIILFFYYAADWIKKGLSVVADKMFNTPINLDYKVIADKDFVAKMKAPHKKEELLKFVESGNNHDKNELNVIKFIDEQLSKVPSGEQKESVFKNFTLQMAQKQGLIDVEYDSSIGKWIRHSKKYIETDKVIELNDGLKAFYEKAFKKGGNIEKIIAKTQTVKKASVVANLAICCASLSFIVPKIQYIIREHRTKTSQAPGIKVYQKMAENDLI